VLWGSRSTKLGHRRLSNRSDRCLSCMLIPLWVVRYIILIMVILSRQANNNVATLTSRVSALEASSAQAVDQAKVLENRLQTLQAEKEELISQIDALRWV
jgi:hypothetical protein